MRPSKRLQGLEESPDGQDSACDSRSVAQDTRGRAALIRSVGGTEAFSTHTGADSPKYKALVPVMSLVSCVLTVHWMLEQH